MKRSSRSLTPPSDRRLACPVCLGAQLGHVGLGPGPDLVLDACNRCGGIWFDRGEVARLRQYQPKALWKKIAPPDEAYRGPCHGCGAKMERNAAACPACGRRNEIACPACGDAVPLRRHERLLLDACDRCHGVWFDAVELARIWNGEIDKLLRAERAAAVKSRPRTEGSVPAVVDALALDPFFTLLAIDGLAHAGGGLATGAGELIAAAPDAAGAVVEGTADLAGSVFEIIVDTIGGIFS